MSTKNVKDSAALRPLHDRLLVQRDEEATSSPGGIVLPTGAAERPARGAVIAVGAGRVLANGKLRALEVKVGDQVMFGSYAGTEVKVGGEPLLMLREEDVVAVVEV